MAAIEFKGFAVFQDAKQLDLLVKGVASRVLDYACADFNARTNLTVYIGGNDNGLLVTGIKLSSMSWYARISCTYLIKFI